MAQSHSICKHFRAISDKTSAEHRNRDACASATKRHQVQFVLVAWVAFRGIECARPVGQWGMGPRVRHAMTPAIQMEKWRKTVVDVVVRSNSFGLVRTCLSRLLIAFVGFWPCTEWTNHHIPPSPLNFSDPCWKCSLNWRQRFHE